MGKLWIDKNTDKYEICPICGYSLKECQCYYGGSAHSDKSKRRDVVLHHLYLFSDKQIKHIKKMQKIQQFCWSDKETDDIRKELFEIYNG